MVVESEHPLDKSFRESWFNKLLETKKAEGWNCVGREERTRTQFSNGQFLEVPHQTEAQIRENYLRWAKEQAPACEFEVDLMLNEDTEKLRRIREISTKEEYQHILNNLTDENKSYLVFVRKIEK